MTVRGTKADGHLFCQLGLRVPIHALIPAYFQDASCGDQAKPRRERDNQAGPDPEGPGLLERLTTVSIYAPDCPGDRMGRRAQRQCGEGLSQCRDLQVRGHCMPRPGGRRMYLGRDHLGAGMTVHAGGDPMDCSLPVSSVHGILQARVLE